MVILDSVLLWGFGQSTSEYRGRNSPQHVFTDWMEVNLPVCVHHLYLQKMSIMKFKPARIWDCLTCPSVDWVTTLWSTSAIWDIAVPSNFSILLDMSQTQPVAVSSWETLEMSLVRLLELHFQLYSIFIWDCFHNAVSLGGESLSIPIGNKVESVKADSKNVSRLPKS